MTNKIDPMAAFLARGGKITTCPPKDANATPLRILRAQQADDDDDYEQRAEQRAERYGAARGAGYSVSDALDESR